MEAAHDFDLIRDEDIDETMLTIDEVNVYDGILRVWLDTSGATTDHLTPDQAERTTRNH